MSDLAHLKIWDDPAIRNSLSWYLDVAENRRPAKFRIAATVVTQIDPVASNEEMLWAELERLTPIFLGRWQAIRAGASLPATAEACWKYAASLPLACSPPAISVLGIAASTV
jgi:putative pyruvate formate lyase activating enzyme